MLKRLEAEEKQLWDRVSQPSFDAHASVPAIGALAEIQRVYTLLQREFFRMTWWRYPAFAVGVGCIAVLCYWKIQDIFRIGFRTDRFLQIFPHFVYGIMILPILYGVNPSNRWKNGIQLLLELSRHMEPDHSLEPLLYVARMDQFRVPLKKDSLAPVLYHRLAEVLLRASGFVFSEKDRKFLESVTLSPTRYPEPLRVAALLTLGDRPEALSEKFRTRLATLIAKDASDALAAAAHDVLSRA